MEAQVQDRATGDIATDTLWRGLTPHGRPYEMSVRPGTSDWNTVNACAFPHDEYHLPEGLDGWALDVGAHIGACAIPLLLDNPGLRVVAIEALPENADMLRANAARNGVTDRLVLYTGAASDSTDKVAIYYAPDDPQHEFIGNREGPGGRPGVVADGITLWAASRYPGVEAAGGFAWAKIDCEGCEHRFLDSPDVARIAHIEGEHHPPEGIARVHELLDATHDVEHVSGEDHFGAFRAVRRTAVVA